MNTENIKAAMDALELFPVRISNRKTHAKDIASLKDKSKGGGINLTTGEAYIPVGTTAKERTIRRHEALHGIYTDKNKAVGSGYLMQALEDARLHLVCSKAESFIRRDELATALGDLHSLPPLPKYSGQVSLREWQAANDSYMTEIFRAAAILRGGQPSKYASQALARAQKAYGKEILPTIDKALDAIVAGNIGKARRLMQPFFLHPSSQGPMPQMQQGQQGQSGQQSKQIGNQQQSEQSQEQPENAGKGKDKQEEPEQEEQEDSGDKSEDESEDEPESESEEQSEGEDESEDKSEDESESDDNSKPETVNREEDRPEFTQTDAEPEDESEDEFEDESFEEPTSAYKEQKDDSFNKQSKKMQQEAQQQASVMAALQQQKLDMSAIQDMNIEVVQAMASNSHKLPIMDIHNIAKSNSAIKILDGKSPRLAMAGSKIRAKRLAVAAASPVGIPIFERIKHRNGGTVLIDASGSMALSNKILAGIASALPMATIAYYSGRGANRGDLVIYAEKGMRYNCEQTPEMTYKRDFSGYPVIENGDYVMVPTGRMLSDKLPHRGGDNIVDFPAIQWLMKQQGPRYLVSDGGWTGTVVNQVGAENLACNASSRHKITWVSNLTALLEVLPERISKAIPEDTQKQIRDTHGNGEVFQCQEATGAKDDYGRVIYSTRGYNRGMNESIMRF